MLERNAKDAKTVLQDTEKAMGSIKSVRFSATGSNAALGQSHNPTSPWPRFDITSYTGSIDFEAKAGKVELTRVQGNNPPRGGGGTPLAAEQRQNANVSGNTAWTVGAQGPTAQPAAAEERQLQIWLTPHGFLKAAMAGTATVKAATEGGRKVQVVSFSAMDKYRLEGAIDAQNTVAWVRTWIPNPVLGDMPVVTSYSDYKDFNGVKFPTKIVQTQGGYSVLELNVSNVEPNAPLDLPVPEQVRSAAPPAPVKVESAKVGDGLWYLTGGSHHSLLAEFDDYIAIVEAPLNEERSSTVIAEAKKLVPNKPLRYLVNTHHHFDHSGGLRTYVAEGATIITHTMNRPFYQKSFAAKATLQPDKQAKSPKKARFVTVNDEYALSNGTQTMEVYALRDDPHNQGMLVVYFPKAKVLAEADDYSPPAVGATPPATPSPASVNLFNNIERLKLNVEQIAPIHGRLIPYADFKKAIGKS